MRIIEPMMKEFQHESGYTHKTLALVPAEHLGWKPHDKSMTMGQLASHIAEIPQWMGSIVGMDEFVLDMGSYKPFVAKSAKELTDTFDANVAKAVEAAKDETDAHLLANWKMTVGGRVVFDMPRVAVIRAMIVSHIIHHRAQLGVYLRLKDIPLPAIYGPSADDKQGM